MVVRLVPEQRRQAVSVDQLRLHLQLDLPQLVVVEETVAMARQRRVAPVAPVAQLWSTAPQAAPQPAAMVATAEQMALLVASVIQLPVALQHRLAVAAQYKELQVPAHRSSERSLPI